MATSAHRTTRTNATEYTRFSASAASAPTASGTLAAAKRRSAGK
jgi:hypothetical protein